MTSLVVAKQDRIILKLLSSSSLKGSYEVTNGKRFPSFLLNV